MPIIGVVILATALILAGQYFDNGKAGKTVTITCTEKTHEAH